MEKFLHANEVADILGVKLRTVYEYTRLGKLPGRKLGRYWLYTEADVQELLATSKTAPRPQE